MDNPAVQVWHCGYVSLLAATWSQTHKFHYNKINTDFVCSWDCYLFIQSKTISDKLSPIREVHKFVA